jgi:cyclic beta-1,2-glucan synthetase
LDEKVLFLEGRPLNPDEESYYNTPLNSVDSAKLYDHCILAIRHGFKYGEHGLPLIGTGDWNDGYDKVGNKGKGESVWVAFFLYDILIRFTETARIYKDMAFVDTCLKEAGKLKENIDKYAWDGEWYKRGWFDNGTPLGTSLSQECRIDSIAQSWSVISGGGHTGRENSAMEAAYNNLVQKDTRIIKLLEPPFDNSDLDPGYIKGYVPGVRENGGQYTHAAIWLIMAFAKLGNNKRVWELLAMVNPVNHGRTQEEISVYKVEPYVMAADVYACAPHAGRGGWTWYTGSSGWMYQLITDSFLGLQKESDKLRINPCIPEEWESFKLHYHYRSAVYHITYTQKKVPGEMTVSVDGMKQADEMITLMDDNMEHNVQITAFSKLI